MKTLTEKLQENGIFSSKRMINESFKIDPFKRLARGKKSFPQNLAVLDQLKNAYALNNISDKNIVQFGKNVTSDDIFSSANVGDVVLGFDSFDKLILYITFPEINNRGNIKTWVQISELGKGVNAIKNKINKLGGDGSAQFYLLKIKDSLRTSYRARLGRDGREFDMEDFYKEKTKERISSTILLKLIKPFQSIGFFDMKNIEELTQEKLNKLKEDINKILRKDNDKIIKAFGNNSWNYYSDVWGNNLEMIPRIENIYISDKGSYRTKLNIIFQGNFELMSVINNDDGNIKYLEYEKSVLLPYAIRSNFEYGEKIKNVVKKLKTDQNSNTFGGGFTADSVSRISDFEFIKDNKNLYFLFKQTLQEIGTDFVSFSAFETNNETVYLYTRNSKELKKMMGLGIFNTSNFKIIQMESGEKSFSSIINLDKISGNIVSFGEGGFYMGNSRRARSSFEFTKSSIGGNVYKTLSEAIAEINNKTDFSSLKFSGKLANDAMSTGEEIEAKTVNMAKKITRDLVKELDVQIADLRRDKKEYFADYIYRAFFSLGYNKVGNYEKEKQFKATIEALLEG